MSGQSDKKARVASSNRAVDRVRTVALLSEGEHGQVFVGVDDLLRRRLVVKRLPTGALPGGERRDRMIHEARVLSRLDHANVLRVYDYSELDEHDVFIFEYLEGTPLVDALAAGLEFAKKMRVATVVASVLSVAHRNGIVHGALSPRSVVISQAGEIKVVDFHSISTIVDGSRGDARWCSPEEQRGAEPTRESDLYRFGLLLREMFGARDRDVRALLAALLCEAPSDRLTAAAALERLQRLGRRGVRRLRIAAVAILAAIFTLGAAKFTLDLKRESAAALAAQGEAESRRAAANELVAFMVEDLRPKLRSVGKVEILDATSNKAFDYFASIAPDRISAAETAENVRAVAQFSATQLSKGDVRAAESAARKAIALADAGLAKHPGHLELLYARAIAHSECSTAMSHKRDLPQAFAHANAWAAACTDLVRRKAGDIRFLTCQARAFGQIGILSDRAGDIRASFRHLDLCETSLRRLLQRKSDDESRMELFSTRLFAGIALAKLGRFQEGRQRLESALEEVEAALRRDPSNKELLELRASYDEYLASAAVATGDLAGARRYADAQLATARQLVAFDAAPYWWTHLLVTAHRFLGIIARMNGDPDAALRHHQAAIHAGSAVRARGSEHVVLARDNAANRMELARSLLAAGRSGQALMHAGLAVEACKAMPHDDEVAQVLLADALLVRGEALAAQGRQKAAEQGWNEALRLAESIQLQPPPPRVMDTHARALLRLGRLDRATPVVEQLAALGYRNREFEALCREKGAVIHLPEGRSVDGRQSERAGQKAPPTAEKGQEGTTDHRR
jgi:tetratricopeptide (TPR) repeat protein